MGPLPAPSAPDLPPAGRLWDLVTVHAVARCLHTVAEFGVADAIGDSPLPVSVIASRSGLHPDALHRMLRLLAAHGVFAQATDGYAHTEASALLRTDHPQSMRAFARMMGMPIAWSGFTELAHAARTGRPATDWAAMLDYFESHPEEAALFNQAMVDKSRAVLPAVMAAYDFGAFPVVADVGGGRGHLLQAILAGWPSVRGVLFELPRVIADAASTAAPRLQLVAGDFFQDPLPRADAYVLMEVLHDWDDHDAQRILRAIRDSAPAHARLLVIETLVPKAAIPHPGQVLDIIMLAVTGGRERTEGDYADLLAKGGWSLRRVIPTASPLSLVDAEPA
jgi:hypothetical protein